MSASLPIRWLETQGWLVLSACSDPLSEIRALALGRSNAGGAVAYVSLADDSGDFLIDDMSELGAPAGYLVDLESPNNNEIHERLSDADMIVIEGGVDMSRLKTAMTQTVRHAMKETLDRGGLILLEGLAAELAGSCHFAADGDIATGMKFVEDALILTDIGSFAQSGAAQSLPAAQTNVVCIGIERGAALALGPDRQIERWGETAVTIGFGDILPEFNIHDEMRKLE